MKIAYADEWLRNLFTSNSALQLACGLDWQTLATVTVLIGSVAHLSSLALQPAVQVVLIATAVGTPAQVAIRLGEVELLVQPIDDRGRAILGADQRALNRATRLLLSGIAVRGVALERSQIA